jgi:hypothetical protein
MDGAVRSGVRSAAEVLPKLGRTPVCAAAAPRRGTGGRRSTSGPRFTG